MLSLLDQTESCASEIEHRYATSSALHAQCVRRGLDWLSEAERDLLTKFRHPRRRQEWLQGRWLAKQVVAAGLPSQSDLARIEIPWQAESRRPGVWVEGERQPWSLSISHSMWGVLVALCRQPQTRTGVDLTDREPLTPGFTRLWVSAAEVASMEEQAVPFAANTLWATKEAIFKACNRGEGFDPRQIEVLPGRIAYRGERIECVVRQQIIDHQIAVIVTVDNQPD